MTWVGRSILFLSSYAPLLALFAVLESFGAGWPSIVLALTSVVSVLLLLILWAIYKRAAATWVQYSSARSKDADVMAFFTSYVVPFAAAQGSDGKTKVALAVFVALLAVLYIRSAVVYVHPLLLLVGWHVFEVVTDKGVQATLLTRRQHVRQDERLLCISIAPNVMMERPGSNVLN